MREYYTVNRVNFCLDMDIRTGSRHIKSLHPYDETEYHWAREFIDDNQWFVYREGKRVAALDNPLTKEQVAERLLKLDHDANLTRKGGIW